MRCRRLNSTVAFHCATRQIRKIITRAREYLAFSCYCGVIGARMARTNSSAKRVPGSDPGHSSAARGDVQCYIVGGRREGLFAPPLLFCPFAPMRLAAAGRLAHRPSGPIAVRRLPRCPWPAPQQRRRAISAASSLENKRALVAAAGAAACADRWRVGGTKPRPEQRPALFTRRKGRAPAAARNETRALRGQLCQRATSGGACRRQRALN